MPIAASRLPVPLVSAVAALTMLAAPARAAPDDAAFRALYRDLVNTDSSAATGSCTAVAEKARAHLIEAGYPADTTRIVLAPGLPKDGNLVARLPGADPHAKPMLLLAHIDVVNANPSDWKRDPFTLVEADGYFHGRGTIDDKAMAAIFVDTLARFKQAGFHPRRTIKLALTCGEESGGRLKGISYLIEHDRDAVQAAFALNEGASGYLDAAGKPVSLGVEAGQKAYQDFKLVATGPGAHSSRPGKDNVLTRLAEALVRIGRYRFPAAIGPVTRQYFARSAALQSGQAAADMRAIGDGGDDPAAIDRLSAGDPLWNAMIRTTCVATMASGGHARNALAQHAEANVNCRILPGQSVDSVERALRDVIADPSIEISDNSPRRAPSPAPPLTPAILGPIEAEAHRLWPGVPVLPAIIPGATDGRFLDAAGIPTYGVSGVFVDPDGDGVHGLDERIRVTSLRDARTFLYGLVRRYAMQRE
jgi:acetylornithine deacetylase/succinyl-diaminopimelate desuccinylase-like protein